MNTKKSLTIFEEIWAKRINEQTVRINWEPELDGLSVTIFMGNAAESIDRSVPAAKLSEGNHVDIDGLDPEHRYYFELAVENRRKLVTAERKVPFEGAHNFRDLGGYQTIHGDRVKWGYVFRSDLLGNLKDEDMKLLSNMDIRLVCDFRTKGEVKLLPDRLPEDGSVRYRNLPLAHKDFDQASVLDKISKGDVGWISKDFMIKDYRKNIDAFAGAWGTVMTLLADKENLPVVFHCTLGKDRAGACAALLLLALEVPHETVIKDYLLSNMCLDLWRDQVNEYVQSVGIEPVQMAPYITAHREYLEESLDFILKKYGSVEDYLIKKGGITAETISRLRYDLLE